MAMAHPDPFFVAVIGGGRAGAGCALALQQAGMSVIVLEHSGRLGAAQRPRMQSLARQYVTSSSALEPQAGSGALQESLSRHGVPFLCNARTSLVADDGQCFALSAHTPHGLHEVRARYLVLAPELDLPSAGFQPCDSVIIGSAVHDLGDVARFRDKSIAVLGGSRRALQCCEFLRAQQAARVELFAPRLRFDPSELVGLSRDHVHVAGYDCFVNQDVYGFAHVITLHDDPYERFLFDYVVVSRGVDCAGVLPRGLEGLVDADGLLAVDDRRVSANRRVLGIGGGTRCTGAGAAPGLTDEAAAVKTLQGLFLAPVAAVAVDPAV